ncbi:MAG: type II toxin-antitoxin system Phd/YefM family antitoxin [Protaetiibacter sp.]
MTTVNIHEAKTHLSRLLARVAEGETVIIAKAGRPVARLSPIEPEEPRLPRIGFMAGQISVPDDFDTMYEDEIAALFEGSDDGWPE